ncbi:hypothetical protein WEI85_39835 [Actinomycetes bacterium KLBMP 9797]
MAWGSSGWVAAWAATDARGRGRARAPVDDRGDGRPPGRRPGHLDPAYQQPPRLGRRQWIGGYRPGALGRDQPGQPVAAGDQRQRAWCARQQWADLVGVSALPSATDIRR